MNDRCKKDPIKLMLRTHQEQPRYTQSDNLFVLIITLRPEQFVFPPSFENVYIAYRKTAQIDSEMLAAYDIIFIDTQQMNQGEVLWLQKVIFQLNVHQYADRPTILLMLNSGVSFNDILKHWQLNANVTMTTTHNCRAFIFGILRVFAHPGFEENGLENLKQLICGARQLNFQYIQSRGSDRVEDAIAEISISDESCRSPRNMWVTIGSSSIFYLDEYEMISKQLQNRFSDCEPSIATSFCDHAYQIDHILQPDSLELYIYQSNGSRSLATE